MNTNFRGGNSRLLAKLFDQTENPVALLDRLGNLVFVNAQLCALANADSTQLVGKQCSWHIPDDETPYSPILKALAPPAGALRGKVMVRSLTTPVVFGSNATGQAFFPIMDQDNLVQFMVVVLGDWEQIKQQIDLPSLGELPPESGAEQTLVRLRSSWQSLDGLLPMIGESPAITLAMERAQLAVTTDCSVLVIGPASIGKREVVGGIFCGRLKHLGLQRVAGQMLPIDCSALDADLFAGMLEVFQSRLRPGLARGAQQLLIENLESLDQLAIPKLLLWLDDFGSQCAVSCTSSVACEELSGRGPEWRRLVARISAIEINLPPLKDRCEDIQPLAVHCLAAECAKQQRAQLSFTQEATDLLLTFPWPENLNQLRAAIREAVNHAVLTSVISPQHLPLALRTYPGSVSTGESAKFEPIELDAVLLDVEKVLIRRAMKLSPRNRAQVARWLGISRPRLLRRIEQLGLGD